MSSVVEAYKIINYDDLIVDLKGIVNKYVVGRNAHLTRIDVRSIRGITAIGDMLNKDFTFTSSGERRSSNGTLTIADQIESVLIGKKSMLDCKFVTIMLAVILSELKQQSCLIAIRKSGVHPVIAYPINDTVYKIQYRLGRACRGSRYTSFLEALPVNDCNMNDIFSKFENYLDFFNIPDELVACMRQLDCRYLRRSEICPIGVSANKEA